MTVKQYLRQIMKAQLHIDILREEIEARRTALTSTASPVLGDRVQTSPGGDRFADLIAVLADKEAQLEWELMDFIDLRDRIIHQILGIDNVIQSRVLYDRYVQNKFLKDIAREQSYSYDRICHIHGEALQHFFQKYKDSIQ